MSNRVIDKGFYNIYPKYFKDYSRELRKKIGQCEFCGHDGKDKNILTTAHLNQNPTDNSPENIKVLCRSCHIQYDQKYHLFTMSSGKKTDNSFVPEKVQLRLEAVNLIEKDSITVLDVYHGSGVLWDLVKQQSGKEINIIPIEIKDNKKGFYLKGDNNKFLPLFDFSHFDIIDLDAYGVPFNQLEVIFAKEFKGIVIVTAISSVMGRVPNGLLNKVGYSKQMIEKIPTLFCKNMLGLLEKYLYLYGVQWITGYFIDRKNYFYFHLKDVKNVNHL